MSDIESGPVLVTGGAGYIGSHVVLALLQAGRPVVVVDDLSTGRRCLVPDVAVLETGAVGDREFMDGVLARHRPGTVMHFAGSIIVSESMVQPLDYYRNNTAETLELLRACAGAGVGRFIFSSTAAVYGEPAVLPVAEDAPPAPINPYGRSKLMSEWMLADAAAVHGLRCGVLRYFNVAGADALGRTGQCSRVATHIIKIACEAVVGRRAGVSIFGADYPTPDGTCVRDYIHVADLADAHVRMLEYLEAGGPGVTLNCGYGRGFSVREVLAAVERAAGTRLRINEGPRRAGDPPVLIADARKIRTVLDWQPRHDDLDQIVASALAWERRLAAETTDAMLGAG